jgi:hypothetical protein
LASQAEEWQTRALKAEGELAVVRGELTETSDLLETTRAFLASKSKLVAEKNAQVVYFHVSLARHHSEL